MAEKTMNTFGKNAIDDYINELRANRKLSLHQVIEKLLDLRHGREGKLIRLEDLSYLDFRIKNLKQLLYQNI
jgi:hypothetical protein